MTPGLESNPFSRGLFLSSNLASNRIVDKGQSSLTKRNKDQCRLMEEKMKTKVGITEGSAEFFGGSTERKDYPYLYLIPCPPPGHSQVMLSQGQSMRQAPHSMQFS